MQLTLEGKTKDQVAIERIQMFEPPEGYYLAFSGGKDSVTLLALAKASGVKFDAHWNHAVDPPEIVRFIRQNFPEVQEHQPKKSMWQLIRDHRMLPTRTVRFCCEDLKEVGGKGRLVLTGIRWAESVRRARRKMLEVSRWDASKKFLHPIIDWIDDDVWQFLRETESPHCCLYDEGWERIGCVLCPMASPKTVAREMARYPKYVQMYRNAANAVFGRSQRSHWASGDEYFNWWLSREGLKDNQQATFQDCLTPFSDT